MAALWLAFCLWPIMLMPLTGDETFFFYFSWMLKRGLPLFDESWIDDKPPGLHLLYLLWAPFSDNVWNFYSVKIWTCLYQAVTSLLFYRLCRRLLRPYPGSEHALLLVFILIYTNPMIEGQYSCADNFTVLPILAAANLFFDGHYLWAAFAVGLDFCIKPNTALEVLPSSLSLAGRLMSAGTQALWRRALKAASALGLQFAAFMVPITAILVYTLWLGTGRNFLDIAFLSRIHSHLLFKNYDFAARYTVPIVRQSMILWIGLAGFLALFGLRFLRRRRGSGRGRVADGPEDLYLGLWAGCALASVWVGGYFFPHYFLELAPVLVLCSAVFFLEISALAFYAALAVSIIASRVMAPSGTWPAALAWALPGALAIFVERWGRWSKHLLRPLWVLGCLMLTLDSNPFRALAAVARGGAFTWYNRNDRDAWEAARYLKQAGVRNAFIYDYTAEIHYLSGVAPALGYAYKTQLVDYGSLVKDNLVYPTDKGALARRFKLLSEALSGASVEHVVLNFNMITRAEYPLVRPLLEHLDRYQVERNFGGVWIYRRRDDAERGRLLGGPLRVRRAVVDVGEDLVRISVSRRSAVPETEIDFQCGDLRWRFPEDGIIYPMDAEQDPEGVRIAARARGWRGGRCLVTFNNPLAVRRAEVQVLPL